MKRLIHRRSLFAFGAAGSFAFWNLFNALAEEPQYAPVVVIPRPFPPITDPAITSADKANVEDHELVLGVVVNQEPRAYPINQLTGPRREIINDRLGGVAIAATW